MESLSTTLIQKSGGKLAGRHAEIGEMEEEPKKKKRKIVTRHVKPTVGSRFRGINTENIEKVSRVQLSTYPDSISWGILFWT